MTDCTLNNRSSIVWRTFLKHRHVRHSLEKIRHHPLALSVSTSIFSQVSLRPCLKGCQNLRLFIYAHEQLRSIQRMKTVYVEEKQATKTVREREKKEEKRTKVSESKKRKRKRNVREK